MNAAGASLAWHPTPDVVRATNMAAFMRRHQLEDLVHLLRRADGEPQWYWNALIEFFDIRFSRPYDRVLDTSQGIAWPQWCVDGRTNLVMNCLDKHRGADTWHKVALQWEGEDGSTRAWTYAELSAEVDRLAARLRARGIQPGDVVALYLPMIPEAAAAFLAVAKVGAVITPLFSGFGPQPIIDRLLDAEARAVITADVSFRRGQIIRMKEVLDRALDAVASVHTVIVLARTQAAIADNGRDVAWPTAHDTADDRTELLDAQAPVMLMYTSGTTGKPKGTVHTHCGTMVKNALDMGLCIDLQPRDRLLWMSDMGWIVGPKVIVSSTLLGATLVMAEGTPDWPDPVRMWRLARRHAVSIIGVVPTMVRQLMRAGVEQTLASLDLRTLRATISVGEPWTAPAWDWFFRHICRERIPILNYAGGTECGGAILIGSFLKTIRPCAFSHPVPGCGADIVDMQGRSLPAGEVGELVMRRPAMGQTRGLWRAPERYLEAYWNVIQGVWVQGDLASRDAEGLWYLHGRSDDTIKVAGKRTGPAEIEAVLMGTGMVSEAAVVGVPDAIAGSALVCVCIPSTPLDNPTLAQTTLVTAVCERLGKAYRPEAVLWVTDLPRTRNQKIMRRLVRALLTGESPGDLSALSNPESLTQISQYRRTP